MFQFSPLEGIKPEEVLIYLRKSRSDDPTLTVEEVLEKHETMLDEWTEKHLGGKIPEENRFREVVSGETIEDRPEMQKILQMIESPKIKAVLVVEVQRLSRGDLEDAGRIIKLFRYTNTLVLSLQKTYDIRDEYDRDMFERELKRGNEFLEYTKKIMNNGRLLAVSQGKFIGNHAPYGYEKDIYIDGKKKCHTLKPKEGEAEVVKMIFDLYVNHDLGYTRICRKLDDLGIPPRRGKHWSPAAMKDLLANEHYIGKVRWNWRQTVKYVEEGEVKKSRPKNKVGEYMLYDGLHPAIISPELFQAAQEKRGRNHRAKATTKIRNPLAGLLWCKCGRAMIYRVYKNNGVEKASPRLLCVNQANCGSTSCMYDEMIERVCGILEQCITDFEIRIKNDDKDSRKLHANLIKRLEEREAELQQKEISQWEKYSEEGMPKEIFEKLNAKVLAEKEEVRQALCKARQSMPEPVDYEEKLLRFQNALDALRNPEVPAERQNALLKACIDRIEYSRGKAVRLKSTAKRVTVDGRRIKPDGLPTGGSWTAPPIELSVSLRL